MTSNFSLSRRCDKLKLIEHKLTHDPTFLLGLTRKAVIELVTGIAC
jgi:hypothetical protein